VTGNKQDAWQLLVIWEFTVQPGKEKLFEQIYGPEGDWTQCFRQANGFVRTELSRDLNEPRRYMTLDFWESYAAYETFKLQHAVEYKAIDQRCESLTEQEREIGKFERAATEIRELKTGN